MTNDTYTPKIGTLAEQVVNFFRVRPKTTLSIDEIRDRFDAKGNIPLKLEEAIAHGWIERSGDFFIAGPKLSGIVNPSVISQPAPRKGPGRGRHQLPDFDVAAARVETGVPIPTTFVRKKHESKWAPLFAKLATKGHSVALPDPYRSTIDSYIRKLAKADPKQAPQFKTGRDENGVLRVWRIA
jgi:hypothetical protein